MAVIKAPVVSIVGPDGSGKTTLVDSLLASRLDGRRVMRIRRPGVLYRRTAEGIAVTEPHGQAPYPAPLSLAKIAYLFCDELLGWAFRIRPWARRGGWVVIERGWWDLAVDPRRYRLRAHGGLLWRLGRLLPHPDLLLVLEASPEVLAARKAELGTEELARQVRQWRERLPRSQRRVYLDAALPPEEVVARAGDELDRLASAPSGRPEAHAEGRWVAVPRGAPRWVLPTAPRRVARGGLGVYQPINLRARSAWGAARAVAASGLLRWVPSGAAPPAEVAAAMAPFLGPDATLAVARTNHPGRWIALVVGPGGERRAVGKVATDPEARLGLAREAEALERFGGCLEAPLQAPAILGLGEGVLVFEVASFRPRLRPWRLSTDVARAAGRFARGAGGALAHGDFAPWNLLRSDGRWVLIDWEYVRTDAPPFYDLWHHLVASHVLLGRPSERALLAGASAPGWVGEAVGAYAEGAGRAPEECLRWLPAYLERSASDLDPSKPDGAAGLAARGRLAGRLGG